MDKQTATEAALVYAGDQKARYVEGHPMHLWWWGLEEELTRLKNGDWKEEDGSPFVCYKSLEDTEVGPDFLDAWGKDIGRFGSLIHALAGEIGDSLGKSGK